MAKMEPQTQTKSVVRLLIKGFMGVQDLDIKLGKVTAFYGPNRTGKTGVLKAIQEALAGGGKKPDLIRLGQDKAEVMLDLGEISVRRSITEKGSYLKIEGLPKGQTEQAFLSSITGPLDFNPVAFFEAKPAEQRKMLLRLIPCQLTREQLAGWFGEEIAGGADVSKHGLEVLAEVEKRLVGLRRDANKVREERDRRVAALAGEVPEGFDADKWRAANVSAISTKITKAGADAQQKRQCEAQAEACRSLAERKRDRMRELDRQIAELGKRQDVLRIDIEDQEAKAEECDETAAAIHPADVTKAEAELAEYTQAQATLKTVDSLAEAEQSLSHAEAEARRLVHLVELARAKPAELMAEAGSPVEGLEITPESITVKGVALANLASSEQLMLGLEIARAMASQGPLAEKGLKLILVDGLERLDPMNLALLDEQMQGDDFVYVVNEVTGDKELVITSDEPLAARRQKSLLDELENQGRVN